MEETKKVNEGDVIQIIPGSTRLDFFWGKLAFVDRVSNWGIMALVPANRKQGEGLDGNYPIRLPWDQFEVIGPAPFPPMEELADA